MKARWNAAKAQAEALLDESRLLPDNLSPAGPEYVHLLKSIQLSYPELRTSSGDLVDLVARLTRMGAKPDLGQMPQPKSGSDFDLNVLKASDRIIKAAEPSSKNKLLLGAAAGVAAVVAAKVLLRF